MGRKRKDVPGQMNFLDQQKQTETKVNEPVLEEVVLSHARNFRIESSFLIGLAQYNNYLKKGRHKDKYLEDDNLLLRTMFNGKENSLDMPYELFDGLNTLEICLIQAGIFKRKYVYEGDMVKQTGRGPIKLKNSSKYATESRISKDGHLKGSLYEIIDHILSATGIKQIYSKYEGQWTAIQQKAESKEEKRFKRLNPYDPKTLKPRMDYIERNFPEAVKKIKDSLAKPFIPEKIRKMNKYGNTVKVINPEGFDTPGRTYRRGVRGRSFWRLNEFAEKLHDYFHSMEIYMRSLK